MFLIIAVVITMGIVIGGSRFRAPYAGNAGARLGSMSQRWLAEHRAAEQVRSPTDA